MSDESASDQFTEFVKPDTCILELIEQHCVLPNIPSAASGAIAGN
jgi:hypothetical protein